MCNVIVVVMVLMLVLSVYSQVVEVVISVNWFFGDDGGQCGS